MWDLYHITDRKDIGLVENIETRFDFLLLASVILLYHIIIGIHAILIGEFSCCSYTPKDSKNMLASYVYYSHSNTVYTTYAP